MAPEVDARPVLVQGGKKITTTSQKPSPCCTVLGISKID
jgi:hypothetical protein